MPIILIHTNLRQEDIALSVVKDITDGAAEIFGIKEIQVIVNANPLQMFAGTSDPNAAAFIYKSLGVFKPDTTEEYAAKLTNLIVGKIGVPMNRFYMVLEDVPDYCGCYMGKTSAPAQKKA